MRVTTETMAEFTICLELVDKVFDNTVRVSISKNFLDKDRTKSEVVMKASTVVQTEDGTEYVLECGEFCGKDYHDASGAKQGTENAESKKKWINDLAQKKGWRVLPGVISE